MILPDLFFSTVALLAIVAAVLIRITHRVKIEDLKRQLEEARARPPSTDSEELTAFLHDVKNHGYGFVRVDPGSVFVRSPRG